MKKITGKVVSLVLALALVVTSFSSTFAFATSKSEDGTVSLAHDEVYLANGDATTSWDINAFATATMDTKDHKIVDNQKLVKVSHVSGDSLVSQIVDDDTDTVTGVKLRSTTVEGKEVVALYYTGTVVRNGSDVTVKAKATATIHVLKAGSVVIGKDGTGAAGVLPDEYTTFAKNDTVTGQVLSVYSVSTTSASDIRATFAPVAIEPAGHLATGSATTNYQVKSSDTNKLAITATPADTTFTVKTVAGAGTGTVTLTAAKVTTVATASADAVVSTSDKVKQDVKVAYKYLAQNEKAGTPDTANYILKSGTETYLGSAVSTKLTDGAGHDYAAITNADVELKANTTMALGSVKNVTGSHDFTLTKGTVNSIDVTGNVVINGGTVGKIKATGTVTVNAGKVASVESTGGNVMINGGTVSGDVKAPAANSVSVQASDEDTPAIVTGKVTAGAVTVDSTTAKASVGGEIKITNDGGTITLSGSNTSVANLNGDYYGKLVLDDYSGTVASIANMASGIETTGDTNATINGSIDVPSIDLNGGVVTFGGTVKVEDIAGDATIAVGLGKLTVGTSVTGSPVLKFTDKNMAVNATAFKSASGMVSTDAFTPYGYTLDMKEGNDYDSFVIKTVKFAGLQLNKTSSSIAVGHSETFTVSNYPAGTSLPEGAKIDFDFDGSDSIFTTSNTANTFTVNTVKFDKDFDSENTATLTAKVVDADGYELTDYDSAEVKINAIEKPDYVSDTNADFAVVAGASYTFKITSDTAPVVTLGTAGVFTVAPVVKNGNDYFVKITAVGAAGKATGVYINGNKLLVASVKAPVVKCDTTVNVKVAAGKSYTYKVTADKAPSFGFGSNGVFTVSKITNSGTNYFFTITATGKSGAATGVFVNGVKVNVATVA